MPTEASRATVSLVVHAHRGSERFNWGYGNPIRLREHTLKREVEAMIVDAEELLGKAFEEVDVNLRDAAEKAWGATVRATDALILDRYGEVPKSMRDRREKLGELILQEPELDKLGLWERLHSRESSLHVSCFYDGECRPAEVIKRKILETKNYIGDIKNIIATLK